MMMIRIQGQNLPPEVTHPLGVQAPSVETTQGVGHAKTRKPLPQLEDKGGVDEAFQADISSDAMTRYTLQESVSAGMVERAKREDTFEQPDKVAYFKQLVAEGRVGEYLNTLDTKAMVDAMLAHPFNPFA
jgi:hypothetical protein